MATRSPNLSLSLLAQVGSKTFDMLAGLAQSARMLGSVFILCFRRPYGFRLFMNQLYNVGVCSFSVVLVSGIITGMLTAVGIYWPILKFDAEGMLGGLVTMGVLKELGPILTAIILSGRIGASITAELGSMKVTEQIDAMEAMAVNPIKYLVVPRFFACAVMLPILTLYAIVLAIGGGLVTSVFLFDMNSRFFMVQAKNAIYLGDVVIAVVKSAFFGMVIATVGCYKGLSVNPAEGAEGVGKVTTGSAVTSFMIVLVVDFVLNQAIYGVISMG